MARQQPGEAVYNGIAASEAPFHALSIADATLLWSRNTSNVINDTYINTITTYTTNTLLI